MPGTPFHLSFADVHYSCEKDRRPVLRGVNFELFPGERVALVGPSGSGKSTVANLLLRFIEPDRGKITVNGMGFPEIPPGEWRRHVALVSQHLYLFYGSITENIRLGSPEASDEEMVMAATLAGAHGFIRELPQGYETMVGEGGSTLSGGQVQRIALARAFLKGWFVDSGIRNR